MVNKAIPILLAVALLIVVSAGSILFASDRVGNPALSHFIMGTLCDDLGDVGEAIKEFKKALLIDGDASQIRVNLAISLIKNNKQAQAEEELKRAVKSDPEAVEPHAILAILYSVQNKSDLALSEYEFALKCASSLNPKDIEIYRGLGALYLKQNKLKEAESTFRAISSLTPSDPKAHFYLGAVYEEMKKPDLCEAELKKALQLNPDYHEALNFLGYEYVEWGRDLNEAQKLIDKAISLDPDNGAYIDSLGWLNYKKGKIKEASKLLEKATSLMEDPVIYGHLGDVYFKLKEFDKAKLNWQKSLKLDEKQEKVKEKLDSLNKNAGSAK